MGPHPTTTRTWVAVGDSFTAGTGDDPLAGGWINRTATTLTTAGVIDDFQNHARRGVRLEAVIQQQVPNVDGQPRIISAIAGANDILERRCDLPVVVANADRLLDWALSRADIVLTSTCPDFFAARTARLSRLSGRVDTINEHIDKRSRNAPRQLVVVDANEILSDSSLLSDDGIHPNTPGHLQLTDAATAALLEALSRRE